MSDIMKEHNERGFTLIELLVAMIIAAIVMTSVYSVYSAQQRSYIIQEDVAAMHQNLRAAMSFMEREIRMAGCDPTGGSGAGIINAQTSVLRFSMDIDGKDSDEPDGVVRLSEDEIIEYFLDGGNLVRDTNPDDDVENKDDMVIAENIASLTFRYLQSDGITTAATNEEIRFVEIELQAQNDDGTMSDTLKTRIHARNLGM